MPTGVVEGAVVVGDLLRPDGTGRPGGNDRTTVWLWNALKRQIYLASGLPSEALTRAALISWIESLRAPADAYWAGVYNRAPAAERIFEHLHRRFCIGYELPPWLTHLLDTHAIPYVDVRLHPVRFLDDLLFAVRASVSETRAAFDQGTRCISVSVN